MKLCDYVEAARGDREVDLLIRNAKLVNVFNGSVEKSAPIAIYGGKIVGFGDYKAKEVLNVKGKYLLPGFIDAHIHIESTKLTPARFVEAVLPRGTTAVIVDPHEIANVRGKAGVLFFIEAARRLPIDIYVMIPPCVPSTPFETSGAEITLEDILELLDYPNVLGLAEFMDYPSVINCNDVTIKKLLAASDRFKDGHAPGLKGKQLNAYIMAGIYSDHECTDPDEALEKIRKGMYILVREGTTAKSIARLASIIDQYNYTRMALVTDDRSPSELYELGHLDYLLKKALSVGLEPLTAIRMITINPAIFYSLKGKGAIGVGYDADLVAVEDLYNLKVDLVIKGGQIVAERGRLKIELEPDTIPRSFLNSFNVRMDKLDFRIKAKSNRVKVIQVIPDQIYTKLKVLEMKSADGYLIANPGRDIAKIAVIERHRGTGRVGLGFVKGLGLKSGALATSVAHDAHNIVVAGTNDDDMLRAVAEILEMNGGEAVVKDGKVLAKMRLEVAGLMTDRPLEEVAEEEKELIEAARSLGSKLANPFMQLSFLALPVIPEVKLTDRGLFNVKTFELEELWVY